VGIVPKGGCFKTTCFRAYASMGFAPLRAIFGYASMLNPIETELQMKSHFLCE
jgi:hypothetical protein